MVSTTSDRRVAERYNELRHSDGRDLLAQPIPDSVRIATAVALPHNGATLEGVVFKADVMEVKWDIYIYDSQFLFARSWTGELKYRALANVGEDEIRITEIECARGEAPLATATVYFLLATHAMQRVLPHQIPLDLQSQDAQTIALWSFSMFGRLGCYATVNDVARISLT
jgi:hypothetical protein